MKCQSMLRAIVGVVIGFSSVAALGEWIPVLPGPVVIVRPPPVIVVPTVPVHTVFANTLTGVAVPGQIGFDGFVRLARMTHFEVIVGPASVGRGCFPRTKAQAIADGDRVGNLWTGVVSPQTISETQHVSTTSRRMQDGQNWTVFQFAVNDGNPTPVSQLNIFMASRRGQVQCNFQVNKTNLSDFGGGAMAENDPDAPQPARALAAPKAPELKAPAIKEFKAETFEKKDE